MLFRLILKSRKFVRRSVLSTIRWIFLNSVETLQDTNLPHTDFTDFQLWSDVILIGLFLWKEFENRLFCDYFVLLELLYSSFVQVCFSFFFLFKHAKESLNNDKLHFRWTPMFLIWIFTRKTFKKHVWTLVSAQVTLFLYHYLWQLWQNDFVCPSRKWNCSRKNHQCIFGCRNVKYFESFFKSSILKTYFSFLFNTQGSQLSHD